MQPSTLRKHYERLIIRAKKRQEQETNITVFENGDIDFGRVNSYGEPIKYYALPTLSKFHEDTSFIKAVLGPIGSGKSVGGCMEILQFANRMPPCKDGVVRLRIAVVRNTYGELETSTIKTFMEWFGEISRSTVSAKSPMRYFTALMINHRHVELEVYFLACDKEKDVRKLKSTEFSAAIAEEACELSYNVITNLVSRTGRYPKDDKLTAKYIPQICLISNYCDQDSWLYDLFFVRKPKGHALFEQPPALLKIAENNYELNPAAENLHNHTLGGEYYLRLLETSPQSFINVMLLCLFGTVSDQIPVYEEYNEQLHYDSNLKYDPKRDLVLGWDFGLTPAVVIGQLTMDGRLHLIDELTTERAGVEQFVQNTVNPYLRRNYGQSQIAFSVGDPSGKANSSVDEKTILTRKINNNVYVGVLQKHGLPTKAASTNSLTKRLDVVKNCLSTLVRGKPKLVIGPKCVNIKRGMEGAYHFKRVEKRVGVFKNEPVKNFYSHIHDGLQYLVLECANKKFDMAERSNYDLRVSYITDQPR